MFDAFLDSRSRLSSYREFIASFLKLGLNSLTLHEIAKTGSFDGALGLRHDVDHHMERAFLMGVIESDMGARATYYLLPPGDYDRTENYYGRIVAGRIEHNPQMLTLAHELTDRGHEIGLHNDFLQLSFTTGRPAAELFAEEIAWFAEHGIPISGSAAHGSIFARRNSISNYEIFEECLRPANKGRIISQGDQRFPLNSISMRALDLNYEAYFIGKSFYVSNSGGALTWPMLNTEGKEGRAEPVEANCVDMIRDFRGLPFKGVQALIHADHWQFEGVGRLQAKAVKALGKSRQAARAQGWRPPSSKSPVLPAGYLESLLKALNASQKIQFHNFGELEIPAALPGEDPRERCAREWQNWTGRMRDGKLDAGLIHLFIQYNSDATPDALNVAAQLHRRLRIPYSLVTFARWISHSAGREELYPLDWEAIAADVKDGLASVGYLLNALHLSRGVIEEGARGADADIEALKARGCDANVFQPWGGNMPSAGMPHPVTADWWRLTKSQPLWINNRFGLTYGASYSDAALANPLAATANLDPVAWCMEQMKPGQRYLLMLHPHLYSQEWTAQTATGAPDWFNRICASAKSQEWDRLTVPLRSAF